MGKAALIFLLLCTPALAQTQPCYPRGDYMNMMVAKGQYPYEAGIDKHGLPVIVFRNPKTADWTILVEAKEGLLCQPEIHTPPFGPLKGQGWKRMVPQPTGRAS